MSSVELLPSVLKENNLLSHRAHITLYYQIPQYFLHFSFEARDLYCSNIAQLLHKLGVSIYVVTKTEDC